MPIINDSVTVSSIEDCAKRKSKSKKTTKQSKSCRTIEDNNIVDVAPAIDDQAANDAVEVSAILSVESYPPAQRLASLVDQQMEEEVSGQHLIPITSTKRKFAIFREWDDSEKREAIELEKVNAAVAFIRSEQANKSLNFERVFNHFKYESYYSIDILCDIANAMNIELDEVTSKRRFTHKELLHHMTTLLLLTNSIENCK
jgi:hypothetical protein